MSKRRKASDAFVSYEEVQQRRVTSSGGRRHQQATPGTTSNGYNRNMNAGNSSYAGTDNPYVNARNGNHRTASGKTPSQPRRGRTKGKKGHKALRIVIGVIIALACVLCGTAYAWYKGVTSQMNNKNVIDTSLKSELKKSKMTTEPFYVLLLGTDGRPGEKSYRSDTIMLARVDPVGKHVTLVSIPRDTMVTINGKRQKINAAHAIGGSAGIVKAVSTLCGVDISHYAEVSFDGMQKLVDAVGGVDIDVEDDVYDPKHFGTSMRLSKGQQHLNGEYAMFYARSRNFADGDYARTRHQRKLVKALASQILANTNATTIVPLVNSLASMVTTDMSASDVITLANAMRGMDSDNGFYTCTIPSVTQEIDGVSYVVADLPGLKSLMDKVDSGEDPNGPETMSEGLSTSVENVQSTSGSIGDSNANSNTNTSSSSSYRRTRTNN